MLKERLRTPEIGSGAQSIETIPEEQAVITNSGSTTTIELGASSSASGGRKVVKKGSSTKKRSNVNVQEVFAALSLEQVETSELALLSLLEEASSAQTVVLLSGGDRAMLFSWIDDDNVKELLSGLKQSLQEQFSDGVQGLIDEARTSDSGVPYDIISFSDPAISSERVVFVRIRTRLYEMHVGAAGEEIIDGLIEELGR